MAAAYLTEYPETVVMKDIVRVIKEIEHSGG
jgi:hypothetical protein